MSLCNVDPTPCEIGSTRTCSSHGRLLKILKNRKHPERKSMKEWLGRPFDAAAFDVAKANPWLRKLKWPCVTEAQLRKILMARDDYHE